MGSELFSTRHAEGFVYEAFGILNLAVETYRPVGVYAMFSGGHDSLCAAHIASSHELFRGAVHINTGIGVEQTREFVRATCKRYGWPLREYSPPPFRVPPGKRHPGIDYEKLPAYEACILHHGFPGPAGHALIYTRLKERCLRQFWRETRRPRSREKVLLVGGMRQEESTRRMGNAKPMDLDDDGRPWCAPIVHWTSRDKDEYIAANGLERNPVVALLCMSGECLCGAFAKPGELAEIELWFPEVAAQIRRLEEKARALGVHATWGTRPPREKKCAADDGGFFGLCWSCEGKAERLESAK